MKGFKFKARAPLALWKVILLVIAGLFGVAGVTTLVLFFMGTFNEKVVDPKDMAFTQVVDGQGYADNINGNNWYFLSDDSYLTISCTTKDVTETKVELSLRNGTTRNGFITDGAITIPAEVELNKPFKVELVRRSNQIVGSVNGFSHITAKSQNILLPTKTAVVAVDTPVSSIELVVGDGQIARIDEVQNVVVGSRFKMNAIFNPKNSQYVFNNKEKNKRVFFNVLGSSGADYITYNEATGEFTAEEVSGSKYSTVYAYTFKNSYYEKIYFDQNPNATTDEIIKFMEDPANEAMVISTRTFIKVLDIEVDEVRIEPSLSIAEVYADKAFTLSANSTDRPNDMSLGISIYDSYKKPAQILLGRVGIKVPKGKANFSIIGGRVMKVTTTGDDVVIEEQTFDKDFDYSAAGEGVEYYILPNTSSSGDYGNYRWTFSSDTVENTPFKLEINFFFKDENGLWKTFFKDVEEQAIDVIVKEGNNSVSLTTEKLDLVINYDDSGKPISADLPLSADIGNSVYSKVVYFLYDNTRDGQVPVEEIFNCGEGKEYSKDYKGKNISSHNISGIPVKDSYTFYELPATNILTVKKSYTGSVVVIAALVRTNVNGEIQYEDLEKTRYQLVCFSGAKVINVDSTLSISNMTPTFSFVGEDSLVEKGGHVYLPAINKDEKGDTIERIKFTLQLKSEDIVRDVEKLNSSFNDKSLKVAVCDQYGNEYSDKYMELSSLSELVDNRTANVATFEGFVSINEELFSAGKTAVDQGRDISLKLVYDDGKETRSKLVGLDEPIVDGQPDYFYVYFQQPKTLEFGSGHNNTINTSSPIEVNISAGADGLRINWGNTNLTQASYTETIAELNGQLSFVMKDQFGADIKPQNGVYSVQFNEIRNDSNFILKFESENGIPVKINDFASTSGKVVETQLKICVVDRKNGNERVMAVNEDGTLSEVELQSDLFSFIVNTEGLDYVKYDSSTDVDYKEDDRFVSASKGVTEVTVKKDVKSNTTITLSDLFRIYTTNSTAPNSDYTVMFDGTWLQGFQGGVNGTSLKKMLQINGEDSSSAQDNITAYENIAITTLKINAPFKVENTLKFKINSNNNLYSVTLNLVLSSTIEISRSFGNYYDSYSDYLAKPTSGSAEAVFADEIYDLDEYLQFKSEDFSWADAFVGKGIDLSSNINGVFYENSGIASLDTVVDGKVRLKIASVRQYTTIRIRLYYGVRSDYAFYTDVDLYVNPNILIEEKVENLEENPMLDLNNIKESKINDYYSVYKATSYKNGIKESVSIGNVTLDAKTLVYQNVDTDGFITIQSGASESAGNFLFVTGKSVDVLKAYEQSFSIYASQDSLLDAVKVKIDGNNSTKIVKYNDKNHIKISFSVCYNKASVKDLVQEVFPDASVITYQGELRLLMRAGASYEIAYVAGADGKKNYLFNVKSVVEGSKNITKNASGTGINVRTPAFIDHENAVIVGKTVEDYAKNKLEITLNLGVTVSNLGENFVYYTNNNNSFNTFQKESFEKTNDTAIVEDKTYYVETEGKFLVVENPVAADLSTYYEKVYTSIDFDKLISANVSDLEENGIYETLKAGQVYKILHDISQEFSSTKDTVLVDGKTYYEQKTVGTGTQFVVVETPDVAKIGSYYEKNAPEAGFYYDISQAGTRIPTVEILTSGVDGYVENLASYENGMLKINSMEKEISGYIVLKFTLSTVGVNVSTYSWLYRIKVAPNFEIGKVNYPYNDFSEEEGAVYGEFLDTTSSAYNAETLTYSIDLEEKFNSSNSGRYSGYRFDEIKWIEKPSGAIKWAYRLVEASTNVNVSFDGSLLNIAYRNSSAVGSVNTIVIEKYWIVDDLEVVGSSMRYTIKINQARDFEVSLYRDQVKDSNKVDQDGNNERLYVDTIIAGSNEQTYIPIIQPIDGNVTGDMINFGSYIKGNKLDLLDALMFKKVWLAEGTTLKVEGLQDITLSEDVILVDKTDWVYASVVNRVVDDATKTFITYEGSEFNELELGDDGYVWGEFESLPITGVPGYVKYGIRLEDIQFDFLAEGRQEYSITSDEVTKRNKKYYTLEGSDYVEVSMAVVSEIGDYFERKYVKTADEAIVDGKAYFSLDGGVYKLVENPVVENITSYYEKTFERTADTDLVSGKTYFVEVAGEYLPRYTVGAKFESGVTYYEMNRTPYKTVALKAKANISKNSEFELGFYASEGVIIKVALKAESYFEWNVEKRDLASGKQYDFSELFSGPTTKGDSRQITKVSMKLKNGFDPYRTYYFVTDDKTPIDGEDYYILAYGKYTKVEFEDEAKFDEKTTYYECVSLKISDVVSLTGEISLVDEVLNYNAIKLEIAPLVSDIKLDFDIMIESAPKDDLANVSVFTFSESFNVSASFSEKTPRQVQDMNKRYGQVEFDVKIDEGDVNSVITPKDFTSTTLPSTVELISTPNTMYRFVSGDGYEVADLATEEDKTPRVTISPDNVGSESQGIIKTLNVISQFRKDGKIKEIARFEVKYRFTADRNVDVNANYPTPDGDEENPSKTEYISATLKTDAEGQRKSKTFEDFFNSPATFSSNPRIGVVNVAKTVEGEIVSNIKKSWQVSVSSVTNVEISFAQADDTIKSITGDSSDKVVLKDSEDGKVDLIFTLLNTGETGSVTFDVKVNEVLTQYTVVIINDAIVKVTTNTPNYNLNRESVFAEDLALSDEQTLFTQNRLLNFVFKNSAVTGATYYVRLTNRTNPAENKIIPITVTNRGMASNVDLGKSFIDFDYTATFRTLEGAQANDNAYKIADESEIFNISPNLTSRVVVSYYDGKEIKLDANNYVKLGTELNWKVDGDYNRPTFSPVEALETKEMFAPVSASLMNESGEVATFKKPDGSLEKFVKVNKGDAYVGYFSGVKNIESASSENLYSGVVLLSKDSRAVVVGDGKTAPTGTMHTEIRINGETWYVYSCFAKNFAIGNLEKVSGTDKAIELSGSTWKECVEELVKKSLHGFKKADEVELKTEDYHKTRTYQIGVQVGDETIVTNSQYSLYLEIEFGVSQNADSGTTYSMREINAGVYASLFDEVDFGIYNTRTGNKYSNSGNAGTDNLLNSGGSVDLKIYGFSDLHITNASGADDLQKAAYEIHNKLKSTVGKDLEKDVVYGTGLNPRVRALENLNADYGSIDLNYLDHSAVIVNGKVVDYSIHARGANNDGNHVMMRITYTVSFGKNTTPISVAHNLLFKVLPNSSVNFLTRKGSTATTASANIVINGQSYASNQESAFAIENDDGSEADFANEFSLWDISAAGSSNSAITAYLYNNKTLNNANTFTYTYKPDGPKTEYNNFDIGTGLKIVKDSPTSGVPQWEKVLIKELKLGTRKFYIDAKNDFGFKIRFYFTLTATENPQIAKISSEGNVLAEGQAVVVGSQFMNVRPTIVVAESEGSTERRQLLGTLDYKLKAGTTNSYANKISDLPDNITKVILSAQANNGFGTVIKEIKTSGKEVNIWDENNHEEEYKNWWLNGVKGVSAEIDVPDPDTPPSTTNPNPMKKQPMTQNDLANAPISVYVVFNDGEFGTFRNITYKQAGDKDGSTWKDKKIEQVYSTSSGYDEPSLQVDDKMNDDKAKVILRGISAFAFKSTGDDTINALNIDVATGKDKTSGYVSRVNDIKVEGIEFYLGETLLGSAKRGTATAEGNIPLVTSADYKFFDGKAYEYVYEQTNDSSIILGKKYFKEDKTELDYSEIVVKDNQLYLKDSEARVYERVRKAVSGDPTPIDGIGYQQDAFDFIVPVIDSIYFGINESLPNVRMEITLVEGDSNNLEEDVNTCVLSQYVTISRLTKEITFPDKVVDNTPVEVISNEDSKNRKVYNDTLEVILEAGESITFAISDKEFKEVPAEGLIVLQNSSSFARTEYVPISSNIQNLDYNFYSEHKEINDFYVTVVKQTTKDKIEFVYNGEEIAVDESKAPVSKYIETSDISVLSNKTYYIKSGDSYVSKLGSALYSKVENSDRVPEGVTFYELSETGYYVPVANPASGASTYYVEASALYSQEKYDETSGKTYYTKTGDYFVLADKFESGKEYYVRKDLYELAYKRTADTELVKDKEYFTFADGIYKKVEKPEADKLSSYFEVEKSTLYNAKTISQYNGEITLHINDASEFPGKTETLYFLYQGGEKISTSGSYGIYVKTKDTTIQEGKKYYEYRDGEYVEVSNPNLSDATKVYYEFDKQYSNKNMFYQMRKTFQVYPEFEKLESDSIDTSGNIEFKLENYLKVAKTAGETSDFYYIIPREVWGENLKLKNYANVGTAVSNFKGGDKTPAYKYVFEVSKEIEGGAGGAFIDEYGNIITERNFNLQESTITVNVYMKVSGRNGYFDVPSKKLKLGTFRIMLSSRSDWNEISDRRYGNIYTGSENAILDSGVISVEQGYRLFDYVEGNFKYDEITNYIFDSNETKSSKTIACEVGDTLNFKEIFEEESKDLHNVTYHIVEDKIGNSEANIVYYNNLDSYKIEKEGTHELKLLVTYRDAKSGSTINKAIVKLSVMAYNVLNRTDKVILLDASTYDKTKDTVVVTGKDYFELVDGKYVKADTPDFANKTKTYYEYSPSTYSLGAGDWYSLDLDGNIKLVTDKIGDKTVYVAPETTGIYTESYVAKDSEGVTRVYSFTFYVVSKQHEVKNVVLNQNAPYNLSNLYTGTGYRFYKVTDSKFESGTDHTNKDAEIVEISTENFTYAAHHEAVGNYIVRDPEGEYFRLTVNYKFTASSSPTNSTIFVEAGTKLADALKEQVEKDLAEKKAKVTDVKLIGANGILEEETASANENEFKIDGKNYLVTYTLGDSAQKYFVRYYVTYYVYKDSTNVTIATAPNTNYSLNQANATVIKKMQADGFGVTDNATLTYFQLNENGRAVPVSTISLAALESGNINATYIVQATYTTSTGNGEDQVTTQHSEYYLVNITFTHLT